MKQQNAAKMCAAAIRQKVYELPNSEPHMQAVDTLAAGFDNRQGSQIDTMLSFLWNYEGGFGFGSFSYQVMFEWASPRKSTALQTVTGKNRNQWLEILN